jgi:hypothetical protein
MEYLIRAEVLRAKSLILCTHPVKATGRLDCSLGRSDDGGWRLRSGLLEAFALPVPGQKFIDALGGMVLQAGEDIGEPGVRIDVVDPGGVDQGIDRSSAATTFIRACEGPVMATDSNWSDLPLGGIVGHAQPPVIEEARRATHRVRQ